MRFEEILAAIRQGIVEVDALIVMNARIRAIEEKLFPREVVEQHERVFIATIKEVTRESSMTHADFWQHVYLAALPALLKGAVVIEEVVNVAAVAADGALEEYTYRFATAEGPVLTAKHMDKATVRFSKGE